MVKDLPAMWETQVQYLGQDKLELRGWYRVKTNGEKGETQSRIGRNGNQ